MSPFGKEKSALFKINVIHTSAILMAKLYELRFELVNHSPYSLDSNTEVIDAINDYFEKKGKSYYTEGIKNLEYC